MMKTYLKRAFQLSDSGVKGLAKSIWSFFLYYVSFVPPMICVFLFADRLLNGNTGKPVVYLLFMLAATLVMYLVINYNYKTTYDETYQESATLRIDLAEQLSKLPLSYFSKHNLSDLAQTIMADVASIEHAFANAVANSIGFAIYFLVISVALLIMNWKLGLCVLLPVLTSASVLFLTKKLQVRDVNKHYDKLRDISESFQNAIELNQEIKSYTAGGSFDPATDMSNMAPGAMGDPILCQFSAFFENPEIFAELDSTSDSQRVQEIYGMILNGIADQNLLVPVTGTHDLALWNTDKITGYDFYTDASYVDIASVHVK